MFGACALLLPLTGWRGRFTVLGVNAEAARLFPRGMYDSHQLGAASWTLTARGSIGGGRARPLPARCSALAK